MLVYQVFTLNLQGMINRISMTQEELDDCDFPSISEAIDILIEELRNKGYRVLRSIKDIKEIPESLIIIAEQNSKFNSDFFKIVKKNRIAI